jgi:hypothetical protein
MSVNNKLPIRGEKKARFDIPGKEGPGCKGSVLLCSPGSDVAPRREDVTVLADLFEQGRLAEAGHVFVLAYPRQAW